MDLEILIHLGDIKEMLTIIAVLLVLILLTN